MNRTDVKTYWENMYVNYEYERPEVCITVSAKYASSSKSLQEVNVKLHLGSPMDRTIYDDASYDTTHIEFVISPHQNVKYTVV